MKLKHLLLGLFAVASTLACEELLEEPSLELNKETLELEAEGGSKSFDIVSSQDWTAASDADWLTVEPSSGEGSESAVKVTVSAGKNDTDKARTATVTISAGKLTGTVAVTQAAKEKEPEPDVPGLPVSEWALVGSFNEWNAASELYLSVLDENYFVYYGFELAADSEFKFLKGGVWPPEGQEVGGSGVVQPNTIQTAGGSNIRVSEAGKYDIYLATDLTRYYIMEEGKLPSEAVEPTPETPEPVEVKELYMLGGACDTGWNLDIMTAFEKVDNLWVWEGNLTTGGDGKDFRFPLQKVSNQWWPCLCPTDDGTAVVLGEGDNQVSNAYRVPSDGYYKITVNPETLALSIERTGDYVTQTITVNELYVLGSACDADWSLDAMTAFTNDNGVFTWTGNLKADGEFRFPLQKNWWPCLMINDDGSEIIYGKSDDDKVIYTVPETGVYTITVDVRDWNNRSYTIEKQAPKLDGTYWLFGTKDGVTKAMMPLDATKSYGYANSEDVVSGVSYAENVFTIASVEGSEGGYTICDASGRYYYQEEGTTYKTFNVGTDASLPGCVWTISVNEDGAFTIRNAASGKYIRFAEGTYTSFGAYAEDEFNGSVAVALVDASNASARPVLNISKNVSVDSDVTTCSIEVTSNLSWTATPSEGVTLDKASGEGNATVVMTFAANEASESVTRTVTFEAGGLSKTFTLTHKAPVVAGQSRTVVFDVAEYGFANQTALESYTVDGVNFVFDGGGNNNSPKYYTSGSAARCYPKNTITISGATIKKVTVIAPDGYTNAIDLYEDSTKLTDFTWEGSKENLVLTFDASKSSGQSRFVKIEVVCE